MKSRTLILVVVFQFMALFISSIGMARPPKAAPEKAAVEEPAPAAPTWPSPLDPGLYVPVFRELPFNDGRELLKVLGERFAERLKPQLKATVEANDRDQLKRDMEASLKGIQDSWTEFKDQNTGYEVSMIGGEFARNAGEGVYKYISGRDTTYFLLSQGELWLMLHCVVPEGGFPALMEKLIKLYGQPKVTDTTMIRGETLIERLLWEDGSFELSVYPARGIYSCNRMKWVYKPRMGLVLSRRPATSSGDENRDLGQEALDKVSTPKEGENVDNIVDQILNN